MQILEKTDTKLLLQHKPLNKFIGVILVLGGVLGFIFLESMIFTSATLICQRSSRSQAVCELKRSTTLGRTSIVQIVNPITADVVETYPKGAPIYEIIILTASTQFSLLAHSGGSEQSNRVTASQINNFIQNSNETSSNIFHDGQDHLAFQRAFLAAAVMIGAILMTSTTVTWVFDKSLNQLTLKQEKLGIYRVVSYVLSEVINVRIEQNSSVDFRTSARHINPA
jgi:hypothetical protein